ncbi:IclR family transcriptional regulator [Stappia indica]|uniref:IclR family transcriptional regulator n=1 Tax=Stappia indica TaxID=538381 RepID=UPI001CD709B0|nr:IclR family transcriptional regulator [Stappia indica]MCA1297085.1 IclR family transcriptional regulator [Stappia indica]
MKKETSLNSLRRGFLILETFGVGEDSLSNAEISARTGMPKSTVSRLTGVLCDMGYLSPALETGGFRIGAGALRLGYSALASMNIRQRARRPMQELADRASVSVSLAIRQGVHMLYIEQARGAAAVTTRLTVGDRLPIVVSAIGQAYLAACDAAEIAEIAELLAESDPQAAATLGDKVTEARRQVAEQGFCLSMDTWLPGIHAIAAPVLDLDTKTRMAVNCGGVATLLPKERLVAELGPAIEALASHISALPPRALVAEVEAGRNI